MKAIRAYAVVCKSGRVHGSGSAGKLRWIGFVKADANRDAANLNGWEHMRCGPHTVVTLTGHLPAKPKRTTKGAR